MAFYDFPRIPKPKPYKDSHRTRLDAHQKVRVVEEVKAPFRLNQALFAELDLTLEEHQRTSRAD
jgi:heme oxygenase